MNKNKLKNPKSEIIRLKGLYRKFVLDGKVELPYESLKGLIGPDCAYHLYKYK
jgi:hypothetical protein